MERQCEKENAKTAKYQTLIYSFLLIKNRRNNYSQAYFTKKKEVEDILYK
ncbi:hypothetical protein TanjilG_32387 [Lupinus angustifolius]|nr:hypothetical protein TanjilG_32387 [Lupinus angustifolius]